MPGSPQRPPNPRRPAGAERQPETRASEGLRRRVLASVGREAGPSAGARPAWPLARRLAAAVGAIALLAGLLVGLLSLAGGHSNSAQVIAGRSGGKASFRRLGSHAELVVEGMPAPPIGEIYEVWIDRPGAAPQPTDTLFTVTRQGGASVEIAGRLRGVREVTVTAEPLGGSTRPTSAPVLRAVLTHGSQ